MYMKNNKMQWVPQFHEMNGIIMPSQILICCHDNACFLSLIMEADLQSKLLKEPLEIALRAS